MGKVLWRVSIVLHRYLGVAVGLLMVMWFSSGIVMMYVGYPELSQNDRLRVMPPFPWTGCCALDGLNLAGDTEVRSARLENIDGHPMVFLREADGRERLLSLGAPLTINEQTARAVVLAAAPKIIGSAAPLATSDMIERDQWTVAEDYDQDRPLFHFVFTDPARTEIYVSSTTGEIVLWTSHAQRFWNWFGAVPHWLYPTMLRENPHLWTETIVWAAVLGTFLTLFGLILGISQFKRGTGGRVSPYRGWFYWHHVTGLVFGIVTLAFVFSGLVSMNPWGFLEGSGGNDDRARYLGKPLSWSAVHDSILALQKAPSTSAVSIRIAPVNGQLFWLVSNADGTVQRLDAEGQKAMTGLQDLRTVAALLAGPRPIASQGMIAREDEYYFAHRDEIVLPVYRVVLNDPEQTRYYIDPASAMPLKRVDADAQAYRWLFAALHRWDFAPLLRARPVWDVVMLGLLLGGLAGTITGVYLAIRRVIRDLTFTRR